MEEVDDGGMEEDDEEVVEAPKKVKAKEKAKVSLSLKRVARSSK